MAFKDMLNRVFGNNAAPETEGQVTNPQTEVPVNAPVSIKIGQKQVEEAAKTLQDYKKGKKNLEDKIVANEQWWKLRHWDQFRDNTKKGKDPEPASAWLFNSVANKHADAMDNFPEPNILPREASDKPTAKVLSSIIPVVLENNDYEQTYNDAWWYKLKQGCAVKGVFWNNSLYDGLGDVDLKMIDLLNIFWEPGIKHIQKSRNLFSVALVDEDILKQQYPGLLKENSKLQSKTITLKEYVYDDSVDTSEKCVVVDWYYKKTVFRDVNGISIPSEVVHFCKFVSNIVLYATENDPMFAGTGLYNHGKYPFVFDVLFPEEGTPVGFGYVDVMRDPQMYVDKLNQIIMKNAFIQGNPRWFVRGDAGVNEDEFAELSNPFVHFEGDLDDRNFRQIETKPLGPFIITHRQNIIDEIKETSGNRDFSQGGTSSGVTAASAIAALQEAGSKLSRDMNKASYRSFKAEVYLVIENIRQFYDEIRSFRITGEAGMDFVLFNNDNLKPQSRGITETGLDLGMRKPIFDIIVTAQKASPFNKVANNELAFELYAKGFFNPQISDQALIALDMMDFDAKDMVVQKVKQNSQLYQMVQQMQQQMMMMAQIITKQTGQPLDQMVAGQMQQMGSMVQGIVGGSAVADGSQVQVNSLGNAIPTNNVADKARKQAVNATKPA
jgi:hypothetical protein